MTPETSLWRTLSFWSAATGTLAALHPRTRNHAPGILMLCGLGGVGALYGHLATRLELPFEPVAIARGAWQSRGEPWMKELVLSVAWHGAFWAGASALRHLELDRSRPSTAP